MRWVTAGFVNVFKRPPNAFADDYANIPSGPLHVSIALPARCLCACCQVLRYETDQLASVDLQRQRLIRRAFRLEWLSAGWLAIEAAVAVASGIAAHSITLVAFGLDSVIELVSAGVLIWRLSTELRFGREVSEGAERIARRIAGGLLFALAAYVVAAAG